MTTKLGVFNSTKDARRMLDEVAREGGYRPAESNEYAITYSRQAGGITEELLIEKHGRRQYRVVKSVKAVVP